MTDHRGTRLPLAAVTLGISATAAAYVAALFHGSPPSWAPWLLAFGVNTVLIGMVALGAGRRDGVRHGLRLVFLGVYLLLDLCFALAFLLPPEAGQAPTLVLGLPLRAAVVVYGVGLLPSFILPFAYARSFDDDVLRPEDLERVRRARAEPEGPA